MCDKKQSINYNIKLTSREKEVIRLVAKGLRNKEISCELGIGAGRVKNILSTLFDKIAVNDRTQLAIFAVKNKLDT